MLRKLIPFEGGKAIVIDLPILALIGAENEIELDLTTDGRVLVLSKPRRVARSQSSINATPDSKTDLPDCLANYDREDPRVAYELLRELQKRGFRLSHFQRLHHFRGGASIENHLRYCKNRSRFTGETNRLVSDRLRVCFEHLLQGTTLDAAVEAALDAHPLT